MTILGNLLLAAGCLVGLAGEVMFLNVAYRRNLAWFFDCLFVPLADEVFLLTHWHSAWKPYAIAVLGLAVALGGACLSGCRPS